MLNGNRHGQGIYYYLDGNVYKGTWAEDQIQGQGAQEGKYFYQGDWLKGKWHGKGALTVNNTQYDGQFINGKPHGEGLFKN